MWRFWLHINTQVRSEEVGIETFLIVHLHIGRQGHLSAFSCSLPGLPVLRIVINSNENGGGRRREEWKWTGSTQQADCYHSNRQAISRLSKFNFLCVFSYRRDRGWVLAEHIAWVFAGLTRPLHLFHQTEGSEERSLLSRGHDGTATGKSRQQRRALCNKAWD